ncbi:UDP-N-acetylglucosamine 4,6-dehydratase (inverting) [Streptoalloteichus tenebrarius]|uniref:UDP-N-acetylglucosamine 4,6-dehydratase (inverting) n=1 Tax=Streptoalloteichus tenebrarius (strain ATCC 17920 / DSM 40477 / JCM 4838 / CBS 697.72 / NBRC 16177 / NCIMB 11028 / NRRL B-12390 / A12253. 1 / ISP 5477) TaxID=1933 RepID=UPI0026466F6D|nr:UDP-N-acetylglucosamine 4,6-dehydratase (inverting) [Streptoalloteichus tenebrarius]
MSGSRVMITGGTGSLGRAFLRKALDEIGCGSVVVYSRDELKQRELREAFDHDPRLEWVIGDVRDVDRLRFAMRDVDHVVHAAALKQVDTAERNCIEYIRTNVLGAQNVIDAAIETGVSRVIALSTDKASSPVNLYGASKLCADKLFVAASEYAGRRNTRFAVVRYGNVLGSRGSVIPLFKQLAASGKPITITDKRMTRFWLSIDAAVRFIVESFDQMGGGEIFVPRIPSMRIIDLAEAIAPRSPIHEVGIRPGEKLHEEMISESDARRTVRLADRYVVRSALGEDHAEIPGGTPVPDGFSYTSDKNDEWLSVADLRAEYAGEGAA